MPTRRGIVWIGRLAVLVALVVSVRWYGVWGLVPLLLAVVGMGCSVEADTKDYLGVP